ncbi:Type 1 glutamine amidotransferase-like domain-containing protein [Nocardioides hwasunensis]|uniref:Type 1 glutamine amidotransferase-like domain-containing protein n=1 Tax=Nocardioides hwasunensis TaxID=397258 RepID=A0ABR8MIJ4_9ACTN|nr:Type 1 glutamine amidotransferase-like domain-containing protein [Nocardioides hwasunensis]MBD3915400.1 Type 1 glutamine amidotransferase-like domain-containing protein [Nocardioides hwasunensis]
MRLLLTSGGVTNDSIRAALVELLGKPIEESTALAIPTAQWGHPMCGPESLRRFATDRSPATMTGLGWQSVGLLELTALPTIDPERWVPWVQAADVLLVDGGEATYLAHWIEESGLGELLPSLTDTVWVGVSAGSMVLTPRIGDLFVEWQPEQGDRTLGVVDFSIFPHVGAFPTNTFEAAEEWAADLGNPAYALDEQSAVVVDGDRVEVVSEGEWRALSFSR